MICVQTVGIIGILIIIYLFCKCGKKLNHPNEEKKKHKFKIDMRINSLQPHINQVIGEITHEFFNNKIPIILNNELVSSLTSISPKKAKLLIFYQNKTNNLNIYVNNGWIKLSMCAQTFLILHEIYHFIQKHNDTNNIDNEVEADQYALMTLKSTLLNQNISPIQIILEIYDDKIDEESIKFRLEFALMTWNEWQVKFKQ